MRQSIAAECGGEAAPSGPRPPRFAVRSRVVMVAGITVRTVVARARLGGLWVYDCVREGAAGGHPVIPIGEHLLRQAE